MLRMTPVAPSRMRIHLRLARQTTGRASTSNSGDAYKSSAGLRQPSNAEDTYKCMTGPVISAPWRTGKRGGAGGGIWDDRLCAMSAGHRH